MYVFIRFKGNTSMYFGSIPYSVLREFHSYRAQTICENKGLAIVVHGKHPTRYIITLAL